ncbi:DUF805 domain-containing protein [Grimontia sp. NTOU-MAR1]|uniref:DUF805 domain-containing protein n=1 Tax=Grimontia sp. NTOU-MAR1 TaxID=3111011 RepID=UPI002DB69A0E|nr:DUF805 domain-containing protein [Grimontia sp. NTOU-MAR1]WRW00477.1 DUF805 domain-containing protein [Grimontia sp. NTOU-MAR1]
MNWYIGVLKQYANFKGRARRKEYWMFLAFNMLFTFALALVDQTMGTFNPDLGLGTVGMVYAAAVFIPTLAVTVRRLHDTDRVGWWALIGILPFGVIALLVLNAFDGTKGSNRFGPDPKSDEQSDERTDTTKTGTFSG